MHTSPNLYYPNAVPEVLYMRRRGMSWRRIRETLIMHGRRPVPNVGAMKAWEQNQSVEQEAANGV